MGLRNVGSVVERVHDDGVTFGGKFVQHVGPLSDIFIVFSYAVYENAKASHRFGFGSRRVFMCLRVALHQRKEGLFCATARSKKSMAALVVTSPIDLMRLLDGFNLETTSCPLNDQPT